MIPTKARSLTNLEAVALKPSLIIAIYSYPFYRTIYGGGTILISQPENSGSKPEVRTVKPDVRPEVTWANQNLNQRHHEYAGN